MTTRAGRSRNHRIAARRPLTGAGTYEYVILTALVVLALATAWSYFGGALTE